MNYDLRRKLNLVIIDILNERQYSFYFFLKRTKDKREKRKRNNRTHQNKTKQKANKTKTHINIFLIWKDSLTLNVKKKMYYSYIWNVWMNISQNTTIPYILYKTVQKQWWHTVRLSSTHPDILTTGTIYLSVVSWKKNRSTFFVNFHYQFNSEMKKRVRRVLNNWE